MAEEAVRRRQARVREEGERWEEYVAAFLRRRLSEKGFSVYREQELPPSLRQRLLIHAQSLWDTVDLKEGENGSGM